MLFFRKHTWDRRLVCKPQIFPDSVYNTKRFLCVRHFQERGKIIWCRFRLHFARWARWFQSLICWRQFKLLLKRVKWLFPALIYTYVVKPLKFYLDSYLDFLDKKKFIFKKNNLVTICLLISLFSVCESANVLAAMGLGIADGAARAPRLHPKSHYEILNGSSSRS